VQVRTRNVEVYVSPSGSVPFDDWMTGLKDPIGKAAIDSRIGRLRLGSLGTKLREVGDGLIELKIDTGPGYRIYLADDGRNSLILLAGRKKTQNRDIKAAKGYWADYKARG
jgi:putative addiction module killer protein